MNLYGYEFERESDIYHHGIKGQKWGVRRFQNEDGSLTSAGKKRYLDSEGHWTEKGKKRYRKDLSRDNMERNPYKTIGKDGKIHRSPIQENRRTVDTFLFGREATEKIQKNVDKGMSYTKARRKEFAKHTLRGVSRGVPIGGVSYAVTYDILSGGVYHRAAAQKGAKWVHDSLRKFADVMVARRARNAIPKLAQEMAWDVAKKKWVPI